MSPMQIISLTRRVAVLIFLLCGSVMHSADDFREFTSGDGRTMEARVLAVSGDSVVIERRDGTSFEVSQGIFSEKDRAYLEAWLPPVTEQAEVSRSNNEVSVNALNGAIGHELFADNHLWDDGDTSVAGRLAWRRESETATQSSFREYPSQDYRFLGARPFSAVLYGEEGNASSISIVYANKGDSFSANASGASSGAIDLNELDRVIDSDFETVGQALSSLLGEPDRQSFGEGSSYRRVSRWDWNDHAFLLSRKDEEFVALSITPTQFADDKGRPERNRDAEMREMTRRNVERKSNGDVVIRNIPMVNQGPKGYCVPATFERCMRYMQIPADMYLLAMAGETSAGGGTFMDAFIDGVKRDVTRNGRSMKSVNVNPKPRSIARYIDDGLPLLWRMTSSESFNNLADAQTIARSAVEDWQRWADQDIRQFEDAAEDVQMDRTRGHVSMIIGYNKKTDEIAVSDSWGPAYEIRWVMAEAVENVSHEFYLIGF